MKAAEGDSHRTHPWHERSITPLFCNDADSSEKGNIRALGKYEDIIGKDYGEKNIMVGLEYRNP